MLISEGPDQRSAWTFHAVEGYSIGPEEENYRSYFLISNANRSSTSFRHGAVFFSQQYTYDLPAPPTPEEVVQESARALGDSLKQLATNNPVYTHMTTFSGPTDLGHGKLFHKEGSQCQYPGKTEGDPT